MTDAASDHAEPVACPVCAPDGREASIDGPADYRRRARILKALANPARLQIIDRLARGECSVGGLRDLVGLDQSTVSKHLAVLRSHGFVEDRRQGNMVFYRLLTPCVLDFFTCADRILSQR